MNQDQQALISIESRPDRSKELNGLCLDKFTDCLDRLDKIRGLQDSDNDTVMIPSQK